MNYSDLSPFIERNLFVTVEFLLKHKIVGTAPVNSSPAHPNTLLASLHVKNKEFYSAYAILLCNDSRKHIGSLVFCSCCPPVPLFIRNYALLSASKTPPSLIEHSPIVDPFLLYLKAKALSDPEIANLVALQLPLFWEAFLLLIDISPISLPLQGPLLPHYHAYLKIYRDVGSPSPDISLGQNTLAALHYCMGNPQLSLESFRAIDITAYFDPSFFEFYAILLYNTNDPAFPLLCESMASFHKTRYETFTVLGLHRLLSGKATEARDLLKRAYKAHPTADIACLLAYAHFKLNDYENATMTYKLAACGTFRSLYSVAQGYFAMGRHAVCLSYCRRALEHREDGTIYKLMGRASQSLGNKEGAVGYFEHGRRLGEHDCLLYLAEAYKEKNEREKVLELYEEYLKTGEKNAKVVASYLVDYYSEIGDFSKLEEFRECLNRLSGC